MAGNSKRKGAIKRTGKGNPTAGSGGRRRRGLEGKGPTPKATERPGHKAYRAARTDDRRKASRPRKPPSSKDGGAEWVAGRNPVVELVREGVPISGIYVVEGTARDERLREIFAYAAERGISMLETTRTDLDSLTGGASHQGVAAKLPAYEYADPDALVEAAAEAGEPSLIVMLDGITDPRNLGAIVRSAAGFGAHGVVVPDRRAAGMTAAAWKTSAGAAARVPVARTVNLTRQLKAYQRAGLMVVGLAADGTESITDLHLADGPLVVVIGSEGKGLSRLVSETCDVLASIPMGSSLESLNAGVAAGVALYEVARVRS
ncbi:23S rRNA (guanosine(2251)-2'-O)-methyltransferase RlmB [Solicola gregarius]|uniref:23S rRNA (Guanosine(2251)-2'-O)-methyltransferase RlmB n=1 Tax=Solicola gregarius TaxID=2908642 RepID=A0AA46TKN4_9ACTN|nr:23S rRNA (guanosine(2251)-2'-O)-methyltransferase RlmB [Solicola gregarius]UYM06845.1 23S rRNA (guanosine(2251)-2'-O)-methyltransferase RlmB [Solicola gregarius]